MKPVLGVIAVVIRDSHVLLVQRGKEPNAGKWGFPGGHVELGETALAGALRELHEETTVVGTSPAYLTNVDVIQRDAQGDIQYHFLLAAVCCDYVSGTPLARDDAADARWVPLGQVGALDITENLELVLEQAITLKQRKMDLDPSSY
ncbi:NUDIX hydrolase [Yoonia sediminilitoris]|uniref:ADP-ribose pyrophosphatase YjhB (NUDIX family) n=1 Tax=Yoonia sediminilitoris TaxID=1286148 RepID=A0A2T6KMZ0_9RHOB|nr:NUDIX hydrolase [Yoonia sediminilitoris]PUB17583.1 ADP-ribose pyrophosphatase YjhB (NUDIX family) [Yoonia sediminilitoris]RCW97878.1 ADP-ribose pyrophosphatase YjhB (NUDIX family) [Yoonia sediminilitoris]